MFWHENNAVTSDCCSVPNPFQSTHRGYMKIVTSVYTSFVSDLVLVKLKLLAKHLGTPLRWPRSITGFTHPFLNYQGKISTAIATFNFQLRFSFSTLNCDSNLEPRFDFSTLTCDSNLQLRFVFCSDQL